MYLRPKINKEVISNTVSRDALCKETAESRSNKLKYYYTRRACRDAILTDRDGRNQT